MLTPLKGGTQGPVSWTNVRLLVSCLFSLYSYSEIWKEFHSMTATTLDLTFSLPDDRCVPFFDKASKLAGPDHVLYYYISATAYVRLCTNATRATVDAALGAEYFVDSLAAATNDQCSLADASSVQKAKASCESSTAGVSCAGAFDTTPLPYGIMWNFGLTGVEGGEADCATIIRQFPGVPTCDQPFVWSYKKTNNDVKWLFILSFAFSIARILCEVIGIHNFRTKKESGFYYQLADDGAFGPLYKLYCVTTGREVPPEPRPYSWSDWAFIQFFEGLANIAMPIVAMYGCSFSRSPQLVLLLVFGIVKSVIMLAYNVFQRCRS